MRISQQGVNITNRYFLALRTLKSMGVYRRLSDFTDRHDINRGNMLLVKRQPEVSVLKPEWIFHLCNDYGISVEWVVLGKGDMFIPDASRASNGQE